MSKAFTREDDLGELTPLPRLVSPLMTGTRNYLTPAGSRELHGELTYLQQARRPLLVTAGANNTAAREELQTIERRIAYLAQSLSSAEVVPPPNSADDRVRFGATVTVRDPYGETAEYRIVGVDEANPERNWVSWQSPIARALLNARLEERVPFKFPAGETELEVISISYD
ncbi:MAG TPA: GreA/GreB family elongation factor [Lacunisphaera sp.]|jgi:transcription elongation factor GreB